MKDEIADGQLSGLHADCGKQHDGHETDSDQNRLSKIQKGQGITALRAAASYPAIAAS